MKGDDPKFAARLCGVLASGSNSSRTAQSRPPQAGGTDLSGLDIRWLSPNCERSDCDGADQPPDCGDAIQAVRDGFAEMYVVGEPKRLRPSCKLQCMHIYGNGWSRKTQCLTKHWTNYKRSLTNFSKGWLAEKFSVNYDHLGAMHALGKSGKGLPYHWRIFGNSEHKFKKIVF